VLWQIDQALQLKMPYLYLGYWIADSDKMRYKVNFRPIEALRRGNWESLEA
jgi:arginine-tRNA-protein transferase